jgi:hypothetical protein
MAHLPRRSFDPSKLDAAGRVIYDSLKTVEQWVEDHAYKAYEPFDGLSSPLRPLISGNLLLERLLLQAVRQSPVNIRPILGIKPLPSTKGRGYMAAGYLNMYRLTRDDEYRRKAVRNLEWLMEHKSPNYEEYSWANHFDFSSRGGTYPKHESIVVWSALIGFAFVDAFEVLGETRFLDVATSVCRWILALPREQTQSGTCLSYHSLFQESIHNANMLGAAMLARTWRHTHNQEFLDVAHKAMQYSCSRQLLDGAWWYAENHKYHWIDNFHTGYNLASLRHFIDSTADQTYRRSLMQGLEFFIQHFFLESGCPRYYHNRTHPIDSQCAAQAIETLVRLSDLHPSAWRLAKQVAYWTITNMQDRDGHFYYRAYPMMKVKTPMMHWAQATTYLGLVLLMSQEYVAGTQPISDLYAPWALH